MDDEQVGCYRVDREHRPCRTQHSKPREALVKMEIETTVAFFLLGFIIGFVASKVEKRIITRNRREEVGTFEKEDDDE